MLCFYDKYKEDIWLMKEIGYNFFWLFIFWLRLILDGMGEINQKVVVFYQNVIDEMFVYYIELFVNLFYFDMLFVFQCLGGWVSWNIVDVFEYYVKICFLLFGGKVKKWFIYNELIVLIEGGYLYDFYYLNYVNF